MLEQFKAARKYFEGAYRRQMSWSAPNNIKVGDIPVEYLMALGTALYLTRKVTEEDSVATTQRQCWETIRGQSTMLLETYQDGGAWLQHEPDPYLLENCYRVLDHLIKSAEKPVRLVRSPEWATRQNKPFSLHSGEGRLFYSLSRCFDTNQKIS